MEAKYDKIGHQYNETRKPDPYLAKRILDLLDPIAGKTYLDIGCGTGNYTNVFAKKGYNFIGIDPSLRMLRQAEQLNKKISWLQGTAEKTGLQSNSIDGIIASLTMHHWVDVLDGFIELKRVLKKNATMILFTSTKEQMKAYWLNEYFPKMLRDSIAQMPSLDFLKSSLKEAGFNQSEIEKYNIKPDLEDKFLYCGKHDPTLYFNERIRNGISSFSALSNKEEVESGLSKLKEDISTGEIEKIMMSYENNGGDYLFIRAKT